MEDEITTSSRGICRHTIKRAPAACVSPVSAENLCSGLEPFHAEQHSRLTKVGFAVDSRQSSSNLRRALRCDA